MNTLPAINYHGIESSGGEYPWQPAELPYVLSTSDFNEQLKTLYLLGYSALTLKELEAWNAGRADGKSVVLTFDDGHASHYDHAMKSLQQYGMTGIFFVSAGMVGKPGQMSWAQLEEMIASGHHVGSHGMTHVPLSGLSGGELKKEIIDSKSFLEDKLSTSVAAFSVPRGFCRAEVHRKIVAAGYSFIFTSRFGHHERGGSLLDIPRIAVRRGMPRAEFENYVRGRFGIKKLSESLKSVARNTVNPAVYDWLAEVKRSWGQ